MLTEQQPFLYSLNCVIALIDHEYRKKRSYDNTNVYNI